MVKFNFFNVYEYENFKSRRLKGSSLESMANAVENSYVFLMCVSENYRQSINCQAEAQVKNEFFIFKKVSSYWFKSFYFKSMHSN